MYALGIVNTSDPTQTEFLRELNLIASDPDSEHMFLIDDYNTCQVSMEEHVFAILNEYIIEHVFSNNIDNEYCQQGEK